MNNYHEEKAGNRLKILEDDEIDSIFSRPFFSDEERSIYFSLSATENAVMQKMHTYESRIYFILHLGYFKARQQFFDFETQMVETDINYIHRTYFPGINQGISAVSKTTRLKQQSLILGICHYHACDATQQQKLEEKAQQLAKISSKPMYVFRELMDYMKQQRITIPVYSYLQDMIGQILKQEQSRLINIAQENLTDADTGSLDQLLSNPHGLYEITQLKREPKDFSNREIAQEIERNRKIKRLYGTAKQLLLHLDISNESVKYYASLVSYYSVYHLNQLNRQLVFIYLLCFVYHRYQKLRDNLINSFIYHVRQYIDEAKAAAKDLVYEYRLDQNRNLHKTGQVLKLFTDDTIAAETPFKVVQARAFSILERPQLENMAEYIAQNTQFDEMLYQWEHIDKMSNRFKRRLRPILRTIDFSATTANESLLTAVSFLKTAFQQRKSLTQYDPVKLPLLFVPEKTNQYLYETDKDGDNYLLVNRYEFLIYRLLRNNLESGDVFCRDSVRFRSLEDDLIDDEQWQDKEALIARTGLSILNQTAEEHLNELKQLLEERLTTVNQRIASGENEHIKIKKNGTQTSWSLPYPHVTESVNHSFFDSLEQTDIQDVMYFVNERCHFMDAFTHVLHRHAKRSSEDRIIAACLLAWGTNMGLGRMGAISDISYQELSTASDDFTRLETLQKANDLVTNATSQLPVFQQYNIDDTIHSSSDGQKFETAVHTVNARHSPKYFGLKKGVVSYTLVANHVPINAKIIGANEHESHYVFDLLFNNTTTVQPTVHSTDTHGANQVNFGILHFFGYQFAPRYRNIYKKVNSSLYGFQHPSQYDDDWLLKPIRKINKKHFAGEWENIQRIIVSLALKTTTQHIIIGKLSSHNRKNKTKRALWEYDNIIGSLYLLRYVDLLTVRKNVYQALNRGESYHQLRKVVSYANFGKLRFKTEGDQQIWNECSRLITNCIIFYNATILSELLLLREADGDIEQVTRFKHVSPVAWQHINFYGRYEFKRSSEPIDLDALIQELSDLQITIDRVD